MKITGERILSAPVEAVWSGLFDPDILQQCVPGCESMVKESDTRYRAVTVMAIGPLKARFNGTLEIADAAAPVSCTLVFEGSGGAAGLAKGTAEVHLQPEGDGTRLEYVADAQIAGKLAQVGARLIENVARKLSAGFFDRFDQAVTSEQA